MSSQILRREHTSGGARHLTLRRVGDSLPGPLTAAGDRYSEDTTRHTTNGTNSDQNILFLAITNDADSWGYLSGQPRSLRDFLRLVSKTGHPLHQTSVGILTSSESEYVRYAAELTAWMSSSSAHLHTDDPDTPTNTNTNTNPGPIAATLIYQNNFEVGQAAHTGFSRHRAWVQKERRHLLARLRNYLMLSALDPEDAVFWLDADVFDFDEGLLGAMLAADKDIITARCRYGWWANYDLNAWVGPRRSPSSSELQDIYTSGATFKADVDKESGGGFLDKFKSEDAPFRLDSVGATSLLLKAELVRQGVMFPPWYVVGTTWESEGWDGVETEGMCYVARQLGYDCYSMPWKWETRHLINW